MTQDPSRLDDLEMRIAHQDAVIEELNEALNQQWKIIDALTREIEALRERASAIEADTGRGTADERPPHWQRRETGRTAPPGKGRHPCPSRQSAHGRRPAV